MMTTNFIVNFRRFLKRRNCSPHTVKNYLHSLNQFLSWLKTPIVKTTCKEIVDYIDYLRDKRLAPKTINCKLNRISQFYSYILEEEHVRMANPVKPGYNLRLPRPLPKHLRDGQVKTFLGVLKGPRDKAMFLLMLRCGLRVEELANLREDTIDFKRQRIWVQDGKWGKDRMVLVSDDAIRALTEYLRFRADSKIGKIFLVEKGTHRGQPISVRGIQKRIEYYSKKCGFKMSCHHLRHTMATDLLNAGAELVSIQDLLGHAAIRTTQRYSRVSNLKVENDYHKAMEVVMQRTPVRPC